MIEEPNTESVFDTSIPQTLDEKLQLMNIQLKTLSELKQRYRHKLDYSSLQERKYNLRRTRMPLIILSSCDIQGEVQRQPDRARTHLVDQNKLCVQKKSNKSSSLGQRKQRYH